MDFQVPDDALVQGPLLSPPGLSPPREPRQASLSQIAPKTVGH